MKDTHTHNIIHHDQLNAGRDQNFYINLFSGDWQRPSCSRPPDFTGRADDIQKIATLRNGPGARILIHGSGGVGKTALSKAPGAALENDYPRGVLYAEVGPARKDPATVFLTWKSLSASGEIDKSQPMQGSHIRAWLNRGEGRLLVIIDDVWDAALLKSLIAPLPNDADVIVTSRNTGVLPHSKRYHLKRLTEADAVMMLKKRLGLADDATHDDDLNTIARLLGHHALALSITTEKLIEQGLDRITRIITRLEKHRDGDNPFKELTLQPSSGDLTIDRDFSLEAALALSYEPLNDIHKSYFRLLGIIPEGLDFSEKMALAVWDINTEDASAVEDAEDALDFLARVGLVHLTETAARYAMHNNLTLYARALLLREDQANGTDEYNTTETRYIADVQRITRLFNELPLEKWHENIAPDFLHVDEYGDKLVKKFAAWLNNHPSILDTYPRTVTTKNGTSIDLTTLPGNIPALKILAGSTAETLTLADNDPVHNILQEARVFIISGGRNYIYNRNVGITGLDWLRLGLIAALILDEPASATVCLNKIALWFQIRGHLYPSLFYNEWTLSINHALEDQRNEAGTLNNIGRLYYDLGETQQALSYYKQALPLAQATMYQSGEAGILKNIGALHHINGEISQALKYYEKCLLIYETINDPGGKAAALNDVGLLNHRLGHKKTAITHLKQSRSLYQAIGNRLGETSTLNSISSIHFQEGNLEKAVKIQQQIIDIVREIGAVAAEALYLYNIAMVYERMGQIKEAIESAEAGRAILVRYNLPQNSGGATLSDYDIFLTRLKEKRDSIVTPSDDINQMLDELRQTLASTDERTVRLILKTAGASDEEITHIIAML